MPKRIVLTVVVLVLFICGFFAAAGRWDWIQGWIYLGILASGGAINDIILWRKNPELLRRRGEFGKGTKNWDKVILFFFGLTSVLIMVVGALDSGRYQWSEMSLWFWPVGATLYAVGQFILIWSMILNPFFEKTARIQTDRGHKVIDSGPYRFVRHPGYAGLIIGLVMGSPMLLGSWWAFIPATATALGLILRTVLEDRMLTTELEGYKEYASRVSYRLIPYIW